MKTLRVYFGRMSALAAALTLVGCGGDPKGADDPPDIPFDPPPPTLFGRFLYATNNGLGANSVSAYTINQNTGLLTAVAGSPFAAGNMPLAVSAHPNGAYLYVANTTGPSTGSLSVYGINTTSGALTQIGGSPFPTISLYAMTIDAQGRFLYTANSTGSGVSVFSLDGTSGVPTAIAGSPFAAVGLPVAIATSPNGNHLFVATAGGGTNNTGTICAYAINTVTGTLTAVSGSPYSLPGGSVEAVAVDPSGRFVFAAQNNAVRAFTLDASTGALTPIAGSPFASSTAPRSIGVDPSGNYIYVGHNSNASGSVISSFAVNQTTGALTLVGAPTPTLDRPFTVAVDPSGNFVYAANIASDAISVFAINSSTGALTNTGSPTGNGSGSAPSTLAVVR